MFHNKSNHISEAIGQLTCLALFFGMRSCEYTKVRSKRKTKLLTLREIKFFQHNRHIPHASITDQTEITSVAITFLKQKNGEKEATVVMHRTSSSLCPVTTAVSIVQRILSYPDTTIDSPVNTVLSGYTIYHLQSSTIMKHIRHTVSLLGVDALGIKPEEVGTHSIRCSFVMFLYLQNVRSDKIMIQGRWKSRAFLTYIRMQVSSFSSGLSEAMIQNRNCFTIPQCDVDLYENHIMHNPDNITLHDELYPSDTLQFGASTNRVPTGTELVPSAPHSHFF